MLLEPFYGLKLPAGVEPKGAKEKPSTLKKTAINPGGMGGRAPTMAMTSSFLTGAINV